MSNRVIGEDESLGLEWFRSSDVQSALRRVLKILLESSPATECTYWLVQQDIQHLLALANEGPQREEIEGLEVPLSESVVGMVASTRRSELIGPGDEHNPTVDDAVGYATSAMIASPVLVGDELVGVLSAVNPSDGQEFTGEDLNHLDFCSYLIGLVLGDRIQNRRRDRG